MNVQTITYRKWRVAGTVHCSPNLFSFFLGLQLDCIPQSPLQLEAVCLNFSHWGRDRSDMCYFWLWSMKTFLCIVPCSFLLLLDREEHDNSDIGSHPGSLNDCVEERCPANPYICPGQSPEPRPNFDCL